MTTTPLINGGNPRTLRAKPQPPELTRPAAAEGKSNQWTKATPVSTYMTERARSWAQRLPRPRSMDAAGIESCIACVMCSSYFIIFGSPLAHLLRKTKPTYINIGVVCNILEL